MIPPIAPQTVQMLWDACDRADPHLNRSLLPYLGLLPMDEGELRCTARDLLLAFERLCEKRPDVVLPFLGQLLNEAQG